MTVEEKRRELFEAWAITSAWLAVDEEDMQRTPSDAGYLGLEVHSAWLGFNAALDAIEIELPETVDAGRDKYGDMQIFDLTASQYQEVCKESIESLNLGIKIK